MTDSTFDTFEKTILIFLVLKARIKEKIITGNPVPKANNGGNKRLSFDFKTIGIKTPKNKTPLYGQKAKAKSIPNKSEPI